MILHNFFRLPQIRIVFENYNVIECTVNEFLHQPLSQMRKVKIFVKHHIGVGQLPPKHGWFRCFEIQFYWKLSGWEIFTHRVTFCQFSWWHEVKMNQQRAKKKIYKYTKEQDGASITLVPHIGSLKWLAYSCLEGSQDWKDLEAPLTCEVLSELWVDIKPVLNL